MTTTPPVTLARIGMGITALCALMPAAMRAQTLPRATGLELNGLPALNYDSDEGFGYGVLTELYHYGDGTAEPYLWTLQPTVFLTTGGRRDFTVFFDSPALLPSGWRLDAFLGSQKQISTPYYGIGNDTPFDAAREEEPDPFYYRFGNTRVSATANVQREVFGLPLRVLLGVGAARTTLVTVPEGRGTTLLADELAAASSAVPGGWTNFVRVGLVWDTRDRETGPTRGVWTEILVQRVDAALGSSEEYTRTTFADRRYYSLAPGLVFANRVLLQDVTGNPSFYDLSRIQTSFKQQGGLGGSHSIRGVPKNRYVGRGLALWNAELRWRFADFSVMGRSAYTVLTAFYDSGRVWEDGLELDELATDLHHGYGGGLRVGTGENFVVAFEMGRSVESTAQIYIGVGYIF